MTACKALAPATFNSNLPGKGRQTESEMKSSITSVVVAATVLAGTIAARAQFTEDGISALKASSTHRSSRIHRMKMKGRAEGTPSTTDTTDTEGFTHLPSVFRNCEGPLPWYCEIPT